MRDSRCRPSSTGLAILAVLAACAGCGPAPESAPPEMAQVETFVEGSPFRSTNGIHFGPDGRLWVASVITPVLAVLDPESGEIVERYGPDQGVKGPDDLAFGPDGSVYWTDITFGEVSRRTPDGTTTVIAQLGPGVNPITFSDDGRLFVSQCFMGDKLFEVDPEGEEEPRLISDELGPGCGLNGMDWGPDDLLYGPRWFRNEVVRVDVDSGELETVASGFGVPAAVKFDPRGRLHVLDTLAGEVVRVDAESGEKEVVGRVTPSSADNLAFNEEGRLFVSSFSDSYIVEILDPETVRTVSPGGLSIPGGLALQEREGRELLFVADFFALRAFDPGSGEEVHTVRDVIGVSPLGSAMSVEPAGEHLLISSWFGNDVREWNPTTDERVAHYTGFQAPVHAIPFLGDIVVSEYGSGSVVRFTPSSPEERTPLAGSLDGPAGLAARDETLWVSLFGSGEILQLVEDGKPITPPRSVASGLQGPEGITVWGNDLLVVEAEAGRVVRISLEDGSSSVVAEGLALQIPRQGEFPATMLLNDIVVDDGSAVVTGDRDNVLYRIGPLTPPSDS